ncbi:MAG: glutamine-hydrolyzing carbamoyl-phosphate synthase small subunit [Burkholderiaceae bacterium]
MLLSLKTNKPLAILALADGTTYLGESIGIAGSCVGEVVFNTAMTGYQEILTDPSYCQQIVTLTYPHIGNYGVNTDDMESSKVQAAGLVIRDLSAVVSNFRQMGSLHTYLVEENVVAIANIDTRKLTRHIRNQGAQNGCILGLQAGQAVTDALIAQAVAQARSAPSMTGLDLARVVTTDKAYPWTQGEWSIGAEAGQGGPAFAELQNPRFHVVAYDFGVKRNILRLLVSHGCRVTVVPASTTAQEALAFKPDGIFLSNGPGDPEPCDYAITAVRELLDTDLPIFGICLGHQIMALASGARTFKMKFGHHGANHPVRDTESGRVSITSQNHGFAVDADSLPANMVATHVSLFDGTVQGLRRVDRPALCFQGHPEASPGPHDIDYLFERFVAFMDASSRSQHA